MKTKPERAPRIKAVIRTSKSGDQIIGEIDVRTGEKVGGDKSGGEKPKAKKDGDK